MIQKLKLKQDNMIYLDPEIIKTFKLILPKIHPAGIGIIRPILVLAIVSRFISKPVSNFIFFVLGWCVYFFRDPNRTITKNENSIVSPADGIIHSISRQTLPEEIRGGDQNTYTKISIFLNIFNVHIQRIPIAGTIKSLSYHPGRYFNAALDKASDENERCVSLIESKNNDKIAVVQIAGLIARRIVNDLQVGDIVKCGQKFGLIKFGSRVDIYLPAKLKLKVELGQHMIGGETILCNLIDDVQE